MKSRKTEIIVSVVIVMIVAVLLAIVAEFSSVSTSYCVRCGAREHQTRWVFGFESTPVREASPLGQWLSRQGRTHEHQWRQRDTQGRSVFGSEISAGSPSDPPPISLAQPGTIDRFLGSATESEVEQFVQVMLSGSEDDQAQFIRQRILRASPEDG